MPKFKIIAFVLTDINMILLQTRAILPSGRQFTSYSSMNHKPFQIYLFYLNTCNKILLLINICNSFLLNSHQWLFKLNNFTEKLIYRSKISNEKQMDTDSYNYDSQGLSKQDSKNAHLMFIYVFLLNMLTYIQQIQLEQQKKYKNSAFRKQFSSSLLYVIYGLNPFIYSWQHSNFRKSKTMTYSYISYNTDITLKI